MKLARRLPAIKTDLGWQRLTQPQRVTYLRWFVPVIVLALAAIHQSALRLLLDHLPPEWHGLVQWLLYGVTGIVVAWIGLAWIAGAAARQERAEAEAQRATAGLERTRRQLQTIQQVGRRVANANDVQELLDLAGRLPV